MTDAETAPADAGVPPNLERTIYGLVLTASMIAVSSDNGERAGYVALSTLVTLLVFYAAHVYAELVAAWLRQSRRLGGRELRVAFVSQWAMVSAAGLPLLLLLLGTADAVPDRVAINLALAACVLELAGTAWWAAQRTGMRLPGKIISVALAVAFGVFVIVLKSLIH